VQRELTFDGENCAGEDGKISQSRRVFNIKNIKKKKKKKKDGQDLPEGEIQFDASCVFLNTIRDQTNM